MKLEMHPQCVENSIDYKKITMGTVVLGVGLLSCAAAYFTTEEDFECHDGLADTAFMLGLASIGESKGKLLILSGVSVIAIPCAVKGLSRVYQRVFGETMRDAKFR